MFVRECGTIERTVYTVLFLHHVVQRLNHLLTNAVLQVHIHVVELVCLSAYDMDESSSLDRLTDMKIAYNRSICTVREFVKKYFPQITDEQLHEFIYLFFPFMFGIYPYAVVTDER